MSDPIASINPIEAKRRLDIARAAFQAAERAADRAIAASDEAGEPRFGSAMNHELHVAELEAINALFDLKAEYEAAFSGWKALLDWRG